MSWPHDLDPNAIILVQHMLLRDGMLSQDPIVFPTVAEAMNVRSSDSFDGRYRGSTKEIHGHAIPKRQNTYITNARTGGRQFGTTGGTWVDDFQTDYSGVFGIQQVDHSKDIVYTATSVDTTAKIENCTMFIGRGALPIVPAAYEFNSTNTYLYIYFCWGNQIDFRVALEYRRPMRIDRTQDGWSTAEKVAVARDCGDTERFFATKQHKLPIDAYADYDNNQFVVELGDGKELTTSIYQPPFGMAGVDNKVLPAFGRIHLAGANGACSFEYYPKRYQPIDAKIRKDIGYTDHPNAPMGKVIANSRSIADPNLTITPILTPKGQIMEVDLTVGRPLNADGTGSDDPPKLVDATLIIPAVWSFPTRVVGDTGTFYAKGMRVEYWQEFNDADNTISSGGRLILDNYNNDYTGLSGTRAVDIWGSAGDSYYKIFTGMLGSGSGYTFYKEDTLGRMCADLHDFWEKLRHPIGQRLLMDRMCLYNAIRLICHLAGIHDMYLTRLPVYLPPGCDPEAPYGPAGTDCPYPVLASGSGSVARFDFGPEMTGEEILKLLIQDQGEQNLLGTASVPLYIGFDVFGQLICEAFNPSNLTPAVFFQQNDPSGLSQIENISVNYNQQQMRSQIDFLGLDPWTNALQHYHVDQPAYTKEAIGFPSRWTERGWRYSGEYLVNAAKNAGQMSSIPTLTAEIKAPWLPYVSAGQRALVYESNTLGFMLDSYITRVDATFGQADTSGRSGLRLCEAHYSVRDLANTASI